MIYVDACYDVHYGVPLDTRCLDVLRCDVRHSNHLDNYFDSDCGNGFFLHKYHLDTLSIAQSVSQVPPGLARSLDTENSNQFQRPGDLLELTP